MSDEEPVSARDKIPEQEPGQLRIYLGAAAGVGKTYAMLYEGHRRAERGTDVVVGVRRDPRPQAHRGAARRAGDHPAPEDRYRGSEFEEMDLDAVLARRPEIALVDEFAHTNVPGSRNEKRWQDVQELLDGRHRRDLERQHPAPGIAERRGREDHRRAAAGDRAGRHGPRRRPGRAGGHDPEALRRRMAHGNIYPPEKIDAALTNYFRTGNLTALRELALLWLADKVDEGLQRYREAHASTAPGRPGSGWSSRSPAAPRASTLIRRAARIAARSVGGDLLAVHVTRSDGLTGADPAALAGQRRLTESLGGTYHQVSGTASRTRCSASPGPRTPPSSCWARAAARGWPRCSPARARPRGPSAARATSTCTSSPTPGWPAAAACPGFAAASRCAASWWATCWPHCSARCSPSPWPACAASST